MYVYIIYMYKHMYIYTCIISAFICMYINIWYFKLFDLLNYKYICMYM